MNSPTLFIENNLIKDFFYGVPTSSLIPNVNISTKSDQSDYVICVILLVCVCKYRVSTTQTLYQQSVKTCCYFGQVNLNCVVLTKYMMWSVSM